MNKHLPLPLGPLETKAKAMDEATLFAWDVGVRDDETDSSIVCHALEDPTATSISISNIVSGTCFRLQEFRAFETSHVRRQVNKPVHILVTYAKDIVSFELFVIQDAILFSLN